MPTINLSTHTPLLMKVSVSKQLDSKSGHSRTTLVIHVSPKSLEKGQKHGRHKSKSTATEPAPQEKHHD